MDLKLDLANATTSSSTRSFISRRLTRRLPDKSDDPHGPKGPLGLTTLHEPGFGEPAIADIIFVHGLNGGSQSTWSKGNSTSHFWPKEWLPTDGAFHDVRIHSFGYSSAISKDSILNVHDFARSLLAAVKDSPVINRRGEKPHLIFVAHSMGGLVVKKAYILGSQDPEFQPVVDLICSVVFLATPHQGAAIAQTLSRLVALVGARPFLDDLLPQSPMLQSINEDFPRYASKLQLMSFYETRPMSLGIVKTLIVEKNSAVMNLANERRTLLDADHRNVAMFASSNDPTFVTIRNALATIVSSQRDTSRYHRQMVAQVDQAALNRFLSISDAPEDDIMTHDFIRLQGSCEWLANKEYYQVWRESLDSRFLWLRGRPGAGKSVLAGHVINDLRDKGMDCCFFFFQESDNTKSSANVFLRSMAWQMAMLHPEILASIRKQSADWKDGLADKIDPNPVWRKVFLSAILKVRLSRPQFWVIDAMDECKGSVDITNFLARIQDQWPLSILVTSRDPAETHLSKTNPRVDIQTHVIADEDSKEDISLLLKSNLELLPCPMSERWPTPAAMASQIIQNSGGCFLWASLICSELREVTSEREIEEVLSSIPSDMDALYSKILLDMGSARFGKNLAKAFITWTTYAFRPLSTVEIQEPVEMDINDKIDDVERAISKCCGNIVYVDTQGKVKLVHATAREFLMKNGVASEFTVSKSEGHRRLAMVCLRFLIQSDKDAARPNRLGSDPEVRTIHLPSRDQSRTRRLVSDSDVRTIHSHQSSISQPSTFTNYASTFMFQHLNMVHSTDDEIFVMLSKFFGGTRVLRWIEFISAHGDLHTIYQAGKTINSLLTRRAQHSPPVGLARGQKKFAMLEKWGDDLIHLVTRFSRWMRSSPQAIHHLIPPFCPHDSAIKQQSSSPYRGINVQGLPARGWDDCLATMTYPKGMKPNALATGPGFFAVGMMNPRGQVIVYDDSIFQEIKTLELREPVWRLAFAESGKMLASAGGKNVRIWSTADGTELMSFKILSLCLALDFAEEDTLLRVATRQNQLFEWDILDQTFLRQEPVTWTTDLVDTMQYRTPTLVSFGATTGLMSIIYRGENIVLYDHIEDRIHDIYEKETGSIAFFGSHKLAEGTTTVRSVVFSCAIDSDQLAASYTDGDLVMYDVTTGQATAMAKGVNTMILASSYDGRTLAGVDSCGNLTLFEFKTLRPLYRVRFDSQIVPKGLTFTSDSLRFIEIRGDQCRVWEPTVLHRTDAQDEDNSVSTTYQTSADVNITAVVCCKASSVVFCAMEDGSVHAYDVSGEPESQVLYAQALGCPINLLYFDETASVLACGDLSGRVTARTVVRRNAPRQQTVWDVQKPLVDTRSPNQELSKSILVSGQNSRLLVSTEKWDTMWPMPKKREGDWITRIEGHSHPRWLAHPTKSDILIRIEKSQFNVYRWSDLSLVKSVEAAFNGDFDRLPLLQHPQFFATISKSTPESPKPGAGVHGQPLKIQIWDFKDLETSLNDKLMKPANELDSLPSTIELIIGTFGSRLVVYTTDHWIASIDLSSSPFKAAEPIIVADPSFVRHFFLPSDWIGVDHRKLIMGVGRMGEILFAKRSELAVIKRGLETTESGGSFDPRRGSVSAAQMQRGGGVGLPMRHRDSSPAAGSGVGLSRPRLLSG